MIASGSYIPLQERITKMKFHNVCVCDRDKYYYYYAT